MSIFSRKEDFGLTPVGTIAQVLVESRATSQRLFEIGLRTFGEEKVSAPPAYPMDFSVSELEGVVTVQMDGVEASTYAC